MIEFNEVDHHTHVESFTFCWPVFTRPPPSQITKQGMSSRVVDEQNVEKQFTSSEIVSNADNFEMMPDGPVLDHENDWKNVGFYLLTIFTYHLLDDYFVLLMC